MHIRPRDTVVTATRRRPRGSVATTRRAPSDVAHPARPTCDTTASVARRVLTDAPARTRLPAAHRVDVPTLRSTVVTAASSRVAPAVIDRRLGRTRGAPSLGRTARATTCACLEGSSDVGAGAA